MAVSSPVTKHNPRPRKYPTAAARQAAYRSRNEMLEFRAEHKTAETLTRIADTIDVSRSDLLLSMVKFALANHDWARFGLTHKTIPYYQGNPIMATKKPTAKQLAARKRFAEMARSGAFKKRKPAKKTVSQKISQLVHEGYPQKQAIAIALSEQRGGKVKMNPINEAQEFTVIRWDRAKNTASGNPVYSFVLKDEEGQLHYGKTKPNAGWVYRISSVYEGDKIDAVLEETKSGRVYMTDFIERKRNPQKRKVSAVVLMNPQAPAARSNSQSNYKYCVEAKRMIPGGHVFETIAGFTTKMQAQDYVDAILAKHKNVTLRIKTYK